MATGIWSVTCERRDNEAMDVGETDDKTLDGDVQAYDVPADWRKIED